MEAKRVPLLGFDTVISFVRASLHESDLSGCCAAVSSRLFPICAPSFFAGRLPPDGQPKPVSGSDLAGVALIDPAGKELRLRRENCSE
jgi:hypothetical protein